MRTSTIILAIAIASVGTPAWAAPQPIGSIDTTKNKAAAVIQPVADTKNNLQIQPKIPDLNLVPTTSGSGLGSGIVFRPLPFVPPAISPELLKGPTIKDIALQTGADRLKVTWTTDRAATGKAHYGLTDQYGTTLENAAMATSHELIVPVKPGQLHLKLSSTDSAKRESTTPDMLVEIPATDIAPTAATSTPTAVATTSQAADIVTPKLDDAGKDQGKQAKISEDDRAAAPPAPITPTDAILGGVAVLLLGIIVGIFLPKRKQKAE